MPVGVSNSPAPSPSIPHQKKCATKAKRLHSMIAGVGDVDGATVNCDVAWILKLSFLTSFRSPPDTKRSAGG